MVMSRRRSLPNEMKAKARFDRLARVISWALDGSAGMALIADPGLAIDPADFALAKKRNPAREQPAGEEGACQDVAEFPQQKRQQTLRRRGADDCVGEGKKPV